MILGEVIMLGPRMQRPPKNLRSFDSLVEIFQTLQGPDGCPWDRAQTHKSIVKHIEEESTELVEAIESGQKDKIIEELGDVLLLVMLNAAIAKRDGTFEILDVVEALAKKLIHRHPHVFSGQKISTAKEALDIWNNQKKSE